uniref:RAB3GAP2_C domain-containing protein n=1 Tax=Haemonchus placei TaxID=6290 RepID=A0A0N4WUC3_HAEPC
LATISCFGATLPAKFSVLDKTKYRSFVGHRFLTAWEDNKRVESIEVITELARLLSAPTTPSFFPVQWILVTDIVDLFGEYVYDRLLLKANEERKAAGDGALPSNFESSDVPPNTVDVAKNWFNKVEDIKEAVPRFYVETTLIGCQRFLDSTCLRASLLRLATMIEKFPHPLSAAYARAYICKIAMILDPADRGPHWKALNDLMQSSKQPVGHHLRSPLFQIDTEFVTPALEWIVQCVSYGAATVEDLGPLWEYCKRPENQASLIHAFMIGVPHKYLLNHCVEVSELVSHFAATLEFCPVFKNFNSVLLSISLQIVSQSLPPADLETFGTRLLQGELAEDLHPKVFR